MSDEKIPVDKKSSATVQEIASFGSRAAQLYAEADEATRKRMILTFFVHFAGGNRLRREDLIQALVRAATTLTRLATHLNGSIVSSLFGVRMNFPEPPPPTSPTVEKSHETADA